MMRQILRIKKIQVNFLYLGFFLAQLFSCFSASTQELAQPVQGEIYEKLNSKVSLDLQFKDQDGKEIKLKNLFQSNEKAIILTLNYYKCTTMCALQFVNLADSLKKVGWSIGDRFRVVTISFDPNDTVAIANEKHKTWVAKTGQEAAKWDFLTGTEENIQTLTKQLNFFYEYEPRTGEYSHAAALFFIQPDGTFYRYLYGIVYDPKEIKQALIESTNGELGNIFEKIIAKFSKYKEKTGKYVSILSSQ